MRWGSILLTGSYIYVERMDQRLQDLRPSLFKTSIDEREGSKLIAMSALIVGRVVRELFPRI